MEEQTKKQVFPFNGNYLLDLKPKAKRSSYLNLCFIPLAVIVHSICLHRWLAFDSNLDYHNQRNVWQYMYYQNISFKFKQSLIMF